MGRPLASARSLCVGLGLDGGRGRRPQEKKENSQPSRLAFDNAQGMEAAGPRLQARFTTAWPESVRQTITYKSG